MAEHRPISAVVRLWNARLQEWRRMAPQFATLIYFVHSDISFDGFRRLIVLHVVALDPTGIKFHDRTPFCIIHWRCWELAPIDCVTRASVVSGV